MPVAAIPSERPENEADDGGVRRLFWTLAGLAVGLPLVTSLAAAFLVEYRLPVQDRLSHFHVPLMLQTFLLQTVFSLLQAARIMPLLGTVIWAAWGLDSLRTRLPRTLTLFAIYAVASSATAIVANTFIYSSRPPGITRENDAVWAILPTLDQFYETSALWLAMHFIAVPTGWVFVQKLTERAPQRRIGTADLFFAISLFALQLGIIRFNIAFYKEVYSDISNEIPAWQWLISLLFTNVQGVAGAVFILICAAAWNRPSQKLWLLAVLLRSCTSFAATVLMQASGNGFTTSGMGGAQFIAFSFESLATSVTLALLLALLFGIFTRLGFVIRRIRE